MLEWVWRGMMAGALVVALPDKGAVTLLTGLMLDLLAVACFVRGFREGLRAPAARSGTPRSRG